MRSRRSMADQLAAVHQSEPMDTSPSLKRSLLMVLQHNLKLHKELIRVRELNSRAAEVLFWSSDTACCREERPAIPSPNRVAFAPASPDRQCCEPLRHWAEDGGNTA